MSSYFAYHNFMHEVLGIKYQTQGKYDWYQATSQVGLIYPLDDAFVVSDRPEIIRMRNGRLHCENGPSVQYTDGFAVYSLNGVRMSREYVMTPADKIEPEAVLKEQNVDMRRELLRKVGVERMQKYSKEIEQSGCYKLLDMSLVFPGITYAPHLLMKNPSVDDTWHLEAVSPECHTIQEAINWRAGNIKVNWQPYQLS